MKMSGFPTATNDFTKLKWQHQSGGLKNNNKKTMEWNALNLHIPLGANFPAVLLFSLSVQSAALTHYVLTAIQVFFFLHTSNCNSLILHRFPGSLTLNHTSLMNV